MASVSDEAEPPSGIRRGRAHDLDVRRGGANPQGPGEAEFAHVWVGWSSSRALDCSNVSMLMVISSSSSGTLVLVPDSSTQDCEGVEYSFRGFFQTGGL